MLGLLAAEARASMNLMPSSPAWKVTLTLRSSPGGRSPKSQVAVAPAMAQADGLLVDEIEMPSGAVTVIRALRAVCVPVERIVYGTDKGVVELGADFRDGAGSATSP